MKDRIVAEPNTLGSFVNSIGRAWPIEAMSPLMIDKIRLAQADEWKRQGHPLPEEPKPPTYEIAGASGEKFRLPHDEKTLTTDADRAAWSAYLSEKVRYQQALAQFGAELDPKILRAVYLRVQVDPSQDSDWLEEQEALGLALPESRVERRIRYVETQVVRSSQDIQRLMMAVFSLSGMADERMVAASEAQFQSAMAKAFEDGGALGAVTPAGGR